MGRVNRNQSMYADRSNERVADRRAVRRDEVLDAKLDLVALTKNEGDDGALSLVRRHPIAATGGAFLLGAVLAKSATVRRVGRVGAVLGVRAMISHFIRDFVRSD